MADTTPDCSTTVDTLGYNLVGDTSGCTFSPGTGDLTDVDADLGLLLGPPSAPWYHPLLSTSPAVDAGNPTGCTDHLGYPLDTDQRGVARVGPCDIGAYEYTAPGPAASVSAFGGTPQRTPPLSAFGARLQAVVLDAIGSPVTGATVTFSAPVSGASGTFADSGTSTTTAITNETGIATAAPFTANGVEGSYTVSATVAGVVTPASFLLSNAGWYVASDGDDVNDCQTPATPCASIHGPLGKSGFISGDTVLVGIGTYIGTGDEVVLLDRSVRLLGGWDDTFTTQDGTSTIDGEGSRRDITVNSGVTAIVERFEVTSFPQGQEGGVYNEGTLTLNYSIIRGNSVDAGGGYHYGGIYNAGSLTLNSSAVISNAGTGIRSPTGTVVLNHSTVSGNTGGGIENQDVLILNNSTVSGNTTTTHGGGIFNSGFVSLNNSTVSSNAAELDGGGINNWSICRTANRSVQGDCGTVVLQNTMLAGNTSSGSGPDCSGEIDSSGYNLIGDTTDCAFTPTAGDLIDVDARLFSLVGLPGYHPLVPGSPAIDAGNPAGCTDHLGSPLTADQRGWPRPVDGDGDGEAICDIGSYEFDPEHPMRQVFLPLCARYYCPDFFDDFSSPASGWEVVDDSYVRTEYLNGEYRVLTKQSGYFYLFKAPACDRQNYTVEVDARWVGTPGSSYGLIFGVTGGYGQYYLFDMNTDSEQFRLLRRDPSGFTTVVPITAAPAINGGTASNHLKVTRYGTAITLEVNGTALGTWYDGTIGGLTGAGLVTNPYGDIPTSDARFDNFSMAALPGSGDVVQEPGTVLDEESGLSLPDAWRDSVPIDMGW